MACAGISATSGIFMVYLLGAIMSWRRVALICAFIPVATMIAILFVSLNQSINHYFYHESVVLKSQY